MVIASRKCSSVDIKDPELVIFGSQEQSSGIIAENSLKPED
ncbi:hypothetical protein CSC04_1403 [Enterobacter roggenkampii]|nr:hypothetical protein CSC04_1403 [Enterobacter roggenkampii]